MAATDPDRAARLIKGAERSGKLITNELKATFLARIAVAAAATDPARAARLIADAERIANSIKDKARRGWRLASIAKVLATTDPEGAERIAQSITSQLTKEDALSDVAGAMAVTDPDRAERIAQSIPGESSKAEALAKIAVALAATDPDRAERIAQSITSTTWATWKATALAAIAEAQSQLVAHYLASLRPPATSWSAHPGIE